MMHGTMNVKTKNQSKDLLRFRKRIQRFSYAFSDYP